MTGLFKYSLVFLPRISVVSAQSNSDQSVFGSVEIEQLFLKIIRYKICIQKTVTLKNIKFGNS